MLPYLNRRYLKLIKVLIGALASLFLLSYYTSRPDIAVVRYPPQRLPNYVCPCNNTDEAIISDALPATNLTEHRILLLVESAYSRHGKLLRQILNSVKYTYKWESFSKNLPLLTTATHGRYSIVIIENYYKYLNMPRWNRQLLDKYCKEYKVPLISFIGSRVNDTYKRARIKGSSLYLWQDQQVDSLRIEPSPIHRVGKVGGERSDTISKDWVLFEENSSIETVLSAIDDLGRRRSAVIRDSGKIDGVHRIIFGHNTTDWIVKMTFLDSLWYTSGGRIGWTLDRFVQVDIDDVFVGARGTRMVESDVRELVSSQRRLRDSISNFTYTLGFSGSYFRNGDDFEDKGDELLVELASNFIWFPHMWRHNHAHEHNGTYLEATMIQNKMFAQNMRLPTPYPYAIAPQHDGVYPVHEELYDTWRKVWKVEVTATEEYPHFKPASDRRGFVHKNISVLPRQTCGLYTHTQFFHNYPEGVNRLVSLIQGGDLFSTILLNPISIFMTHQQNFAHDRLAIYTFENAVRFINCWTNIKLKWQDPISSSKMYFSLWPQERTPVWSNPCTDPRHAVIMPPSLNCTNFTLPNVLIVGPQKTGSTALSSFLSLHPNTSTNEPIPGSWEELQFFGGANYHLGIQWYSSNFKPSLVVFEKSATYFDNTDSARQVASLIPDAKIVVILYDPSRRAYSWYQHLLAHNDSVALEAGSLVTILDGETPSLKKIRQRCISGGRYTHHLDRWLELFPSSQIHLVDGERLRDQPAKVLHQLSEKLGLPSFDYEKAIRFSPSKGYFCQLVSGKTRCLGGGKGRGYRPMTPEERTRLNGIFRTDNMALHKFLVKNKLPVPVWLTNVLENPDS